jgi:two-component system chemotaxis response regulator CheB
MAGRIIVVGASLGGVTALQALVARLPPDFPAPILVVLHIGNRPSVLPALLQARGPLRAQHAVDGEPLRGGRIYVAPPDLHMLVEEDRVRLSRGAKENHSRPAVDPLFRSAALAHRESVVGVVLTGRLDDGTAGLQAVKACGGVAVVQDPADAEEPSMPASARKYVQVDHCLPLERIPELLVSLAQSEVTATPPAEPPAELVREHELSLYRGDAMEQLQGLGNPSGFVCPECNGGLWELSQSRPTRYRCHTGHGFSLRSLLQAQGEASDMALWSAIRALQEQHGLLKAVAANLRGEGRAQEALVREEEAETILRHSEFFRKLIESLPPSRTD